MTLYRKGDHGTEVIGIKLPAVVTVNDSLNEPRLASMRGIMMAKKKPMESLSPSDLGMGAEELGLQGSMTEVLKFEKPESRKEGERFEGDETETVPMAIQKLVSEAKLAV
jgi:electron transfer flavoprotein beta subunit